MHLTHFATRPVAVLAALSLVLAACGDSTAPDAPFDAAGTTSDMEVAEAAFSDPSVVSFTAFSGAISTVVNGSPAMTMAVTSPAQLSNRENLKRLAEGMRAQLSRGAGTRASFATSGIPAEYAGKTFEYDPNTDEYYVGTLEGAPSNGVRFLLYAVDPITHEPTEALTAIGYVEITSTMDANTHAVTVKVVSQEVTYLDYTASVTFIEGESLTLSLSGFVTNGTDIAEFTVSAQESNAGLTFTYVLKIPTRDFRISMTLTLDAGFETATLTFEVRGPHGRVTITGTETASDLTYTVRVNGDVFATITESGVVGADGQPLSEEELETLQHVFEASLDAPGRYLGDLVVPAVAL